MIRVRVTFSIKDLKGSLTHELLVPEINNDLIRERLNEEMSEMLTTDYLPMIVDEIILVVNLPNFSPSH